MGTIHKTIRGLTAGGLPVGLLALAAGAGHAQFAQSPGPSHNFAMVEYFDVPFDQQVMTRMTSAEARPVSGSVGVLDIRQFKLESFNTNGRTEMVITAPQCLFSTVDNTANSAGPIRVESGDGQLSLAGDGFFWRQNEKCLSISNRVVTVISSNAPALLNASTKPTRTQP